MGQEREVKQRAVVKARNLATGEVFNFSPQYRFGKDPKHIYAPPNFTDETAFPTCMRLKEAQVGDEVFIEWRSDRFYALDLDRKEYIAGPTVWRRSQILEHTTVSVSDESA